MFVLCTYIEDSDNPPNVIIIACSKDESRLEELKKESEKNEQDRREIIDFFYRSLNKLVKANPFDRESTRKMPDNKVAQLYSAWSKSMGDKAFDETFEKFGPEHMKMYSNANQIKISSHSLQAFFYIDETEEI
jgi:hypothetical protein